MGTTIRDGKLIFTDGTIQDTAAVGAALARQEIIGLIIALSPAEGNK